jgi:hypothetical protein
VGLTDDQYRKVRGDLIREFRSWRSNTANHDCADVVLDLRYHQGDRDLLRWTAGDVERLLLEWIPRRVLVPDALLGELAGGVRDFLTYLGESGRLAPGSDPTAVLVAAVARHAPEMARRAGDPGRFGRAAGSGDDLAYDLEPEYDLEDDADDLEWDDGDLEDPATVLPARPAADVRLATALASASLAFRRLCTLHEYFSEPRKLTAKGNLSLADARFLVDALETGDVMDEVIGDRRFKTTSAADLYSLDSIVEFAKQARVLRVYAGKLVAVKVWQGRRGYPLEVVIDLADLMIDEGILGDRGRRWVGDGAEFLMEASVPAILAGLYEAPMPFDRLADGLVRAVNDAFAISDSERRVYAGVVPFWLERIVTALADLSLLEWQEPETFDDYGRERRRGGLLAITELGTFWCQARLGEHGFATPIGRTPTLADPPAEIVAGLAAILVSPGLDAMVAAVMSLGDPEAVAEAIGRWWTVDHPAAAEVLGAIENSLPAPKVRRAAHRARFRLRNR